MNRKTNRRLILKGMLACSTLPLIVPEKWMKQLSPVSKKYKLKLSLNVYSFHRPLTAGEIDLFDVLDFCADYNFDAIDPTGYYFPGYPEVPEDAYIREFKRTAFLLGLDISGTGIRNDFANPDPLAREKDVELISKWLEVAAKLGAPVLRIFPGHHPHNGYSREEVYSWMANEIQKCCKCAERYGVMLALQNHNGFLKTAADVDRLFHIVQSDWLGLNLDIGSYRQRPPYEEISQNVHHAITWQIKENVWIDGVETPTDFKRLIKIIKDYGYRGYLPIETLGAGDPFEKVPVLLEHVQQAL